VCNVSMEGMLVNVLLLTADCVAEAGDPCVGVERVHESIVRVNRTMIDLIFIP